MNPQRTSTRHVLIGLGTGAAVTLAMGQAAAPDRRQPPPQAQPAQRYQISATRDNLGNDYLFILDHQTQRVYRRSAANVGGQSLTVEQLIQASN